MDPPGNEKPKPRKYFCPNPNCKTLFSRPKIIKYTVCPTCQTLVDDTNIAQQVDIIAASKNRKTTRRRKPPKITEVGFLEVKAVENLETRNDQIEFASSVPLNPEKTETNEKVVDLEPVRTLQLEMTELIAPQQVETVSNERVPELKSGGQFCFGYLSHRKSGEKIPNNCIECPESLNCLLVEYHKSDKSVEEISKWYK